MLDNLIHHIYDNFYIGLYLIDNLGILFGIIFTPLTWIFNFVRGFFVAAFATDITPTITWTMPDNIMAVFSAVIPYWTTLTFAVGAGLSILILIFILKRFTSI